MILVVSVAQMGVAGCACRDVPRDQWPPDLAARLPEGSHYRECADGLDGWLRFNAPLTHDVLKSLGASVRANEASAATNTTGR